MPGSQDPSMRLLLQHGPERNGFGNLRLTQPWTAAQGLRNRSPSLNQAERRVHPGIPGYINRRAAFENQPNARRADDRQPEFALPSAKMTGKKLRKDICFQFLKIQNQETPPDESRAAAFRAKARWKSKPVFPPVRRRRRRWPVHLESGQPSSPWAPRFRSFLFRPSSPIPSSCISRLAGLASPRPIPGRRPHHPSVRVPGARFTVHEWERNHRPLAIEKESKSRPSIDVRPGLRFLRLQSRSQGHYLLGPWSTHEFAFGRVKLLKPDLAGVGF